MPVPFKSYQTLVKDQVVAVQGSSIVPLDFNVGTPELAIVEANAAMGIFLEFLANAILALARAATSQGTDLDSWMAQFQFTRLPAIASIGNVTFSRFTTTTSVTIPVGSLVKTTDFSLEFTVIADTTNPNFSPSLNAYVMNVGIASTLARVQCSTPGAIGNVGANQITFISSPIAGVDTVNNAMEFTNGKNAESDAAFRARFVLYINSLSRAVLLAYAYVLASIPQITRYNVVENKNFSGGIQEGYVYVVIDDGTGSPPSGLLAQATAAVQSVRGLAIHNDVFAPIPLTINFLFDLIISPAITQAAMTTLLTNTLTTYINAFPFNSILIYTKLYEVIYNASGYILEVSNLLINGGTVDIVGGANDALIIGTVLIGYI